MTESERKAMKEAAKVAIEDIKKEYSKVFLGFSSDVDPIMDLIVEEYLQNQYKLTYSYCGFILSKPVSEKKDKHKKSHLPK